MRQEIYSGCGLADEQWGNQKRPEAVRYCQRDEEKTLHTPEDSTSQVPWRSISRKKPYRRNPLQDGGGPPPGATKNSWKKKGFPAAHVLAGIERSNVWSACSNFQGTYSSVVPVDCSISSSGCSAVFFSGLLDRCKFFVFLFRTLLTFFHWHFFCCN